jgi:hypothetical protein
LNEQIVRAAIRYDGKVYSVPRPGRHHHVIHHMALLGLKSRDMNDQGFATSTGRFVGREEAVGIARAADQIKIKTCPADELFSEDVW